MVSDTAADIAGPPAADFKLLTNHGQTLLLITHDPRARMRDIAALLNITERAAQRIVADLVRAGYVHRERDGRRNRYSVANVKSGAAPDVVRLSIGIEDKEDLIADLEQALSA